MSSQRYLITSGDIPLQTIVDICQTLHYTTHINPIDTSNMIATDFFDLILSNKNEEITLLFRKYKSSDYETIDGLTYAHLTKSHKTMNNIWIISSSANSHKAFYVLREIANNIGGYISQNNPETFADWKEYSGLTLLLVTHKYQHTFHWFRNALEVRQWLDENDLTDSSNVLILDDQSVDDIQIENFSGFTYPNK